MSGGSFNYFCDKWDGCGEWPLTSISCTLRDLADCAVSYDCDAAAPVLREFAKKCEALVAEGQRLAPLMKAIEWCASGDWGREDIRDELAKLRGDDV